MEARREARRRRILENADSRMRRVMEIQSIARKKPDKSATCEKDDDDNIKPSLPACNDKDEANLDTTAEKQSEIEKDSSTMKTAEKELLAHESENDDILTYEQTPSDLHKANGIEEGTGFQPNAQVLKYIEQKQMVYRILLIFGLAILLVIVSNMKTVENTRYGEVRNSSFLPYFITLELILLCLFPVRRELKKSSMIHLVLAIFGLSESNLRIFHIGLSLATRLFQDFAWFIFTVAILNYYMAIS